MKKLRLPFLLLSLLFIVTACEEASMVVSNVDEREANVIVVFLESKGIKASKTAMAKSAVGGDTGGAKYSIMVDQSQMIEAMAILNRNGLPQRQGTSLLELFAKQGLMSTDKEETIRYQAGLAQQITNTILMIDGVIDATVQLSFPAQEAGITTETEHEPPITAAVYVKHQGMIDDPNLHLENKIKRLVSGSVNGLDVNNVTVVSDRSRFTDVSVQPVVESIASDGREYVKIWSIVMSKESAARFRFLFFLIMIIAICLAILSGLVIWKAYPLLRKREGLGNLFKPLGKKKKEEAPEEEPPAPEGPIT